MSEQVNHPQHYGGEDNPYEAIRVIENWNLGFCLGNVVKYISRAGKKDAGKVLEDLRKSRWYLDREIQKLEGEEKKFQPEKPLTFSGKEIVEWMSNGSVYRALVGDATNLIEGTIYCTDFNKHTAPILTAHDPEETLEAGATNRLKPVEDKADPFKEANEAAKEALFTCFAAPLFEKYKDEIDQHLDVLVDNAVITPNEAAVMAGRPTSDDPEDDKVQWKFKPTEEEIRAAHIKALSDYVVSVVQDAASKNIRPKATWRDEAY